jgi:hypothetical protein
MLFSKYFTIGKQVLRPSNGSKTVQAQATVLAVVLSTCSWMPEDTSIPVPCFYWIGMPLTAHTPNPWIKRCERHCQNGVKFQFSAAKGIAKSRLVPGVLLKTIAVADAWAGLPVSTGN